MAAPPANIPNEAGAWDADFGFDYLGRLYDALKQRFELALLGDAESALASQASRLAFVRHDVDVSLVRAMNLARFEAERGVRATYHVMLDSPFYDVDSEKDRLRAIAGHGHEIGVHYDVRARRTEKASAEARAKDIDDVCDRLAVIAGTPVRSISFHLPIPDLVRGSLRVAGRVSGYAAELMEWYMSDSRARWRDGDPLLGVAKPRARVLQILIHPVWWGPENERPETRLRVLLEELAHDTGKSYATLRDAMWDHVLYRAPDVTPT